MLKRPELFLNGYHVTHFPLSDDIRRLVEKECWQELDQEVGKLVAKGGGLYNFLQSFHEFNDIEFIISIRDAQNDWEEDGIWHDDGTRVFAFSLSLTLDDDLKGGRLGIRRINDEGPFPLIPTPSFGGIILFLTGIYGFEHRIHRVTKGRRIIIAGWCT